MQADKCAACQKEFNNKTRKPRRLQCSCVMCEKCLKAMFQFSKKLVCYIHNMVTEKPIEELELVKFKQQTQYHENQSDTCYIHQNEQNLQCIQERKLACTKCESIQHETHECKTPQEDMNELKKEIQQNLLTLENTMHNQQIKQNSVKNFLKSSKSAISYLIITIQTNYIQQVQQICQEILLNKISQLENYSQEMSDLEYQSRELNQKIELIKQMQENTVDQCNQKKGEVQNMLSFIKERVENKCQKFQNIQMEQVEQINHQMQKKLLGEKFDNYVKEEQAKTTKLTQQFEKEIQYLKQSDQQKEIQFQTVIKEKEDQIKKLNLQQSQAFEQSKFQSEQIQSLNHQVKVQNQNQEQIKQEKDKIN